MQLCYTRSTKYNLYPADLKENPYSGIALAVTNKYAYFYIEAQRSGE